MNYVIIFGADESLTLGFNSFWALTFIRGLLLPTIAISRSICKLRLVLLQSFRRILWRN